MYETKFLQEWAYVITRFREQRCKLISTHQLHLNSDLRQLCRDRWICHRLKKE